MKRAPLVDPRSGFVWLPASSHSDPSKFLRRQRKRMADADAARKDAAGRSERSGVKNREDRVVVLNAIRTMTP